MPFQINLEIIPQNMFTLGNTIVLDELNKPHNIRLLKMMPYKKCTVWKYIYAQLTYRKLVANKTLKIPPDNVQGHRNKMNDKI